MMQTSDHLPGTVLGQYRVLGPLGSGGMAEVVLAEYIREPLRPRVAIKLVRGALASPSVNARLKTEQRILAKLDHPNIARFLDRGTTSRGIPYIVMEYVPGEPIDVYCDRHQLTLEQRLRMFLRVCAAVQAAHSLQIVHRDLKPQNILVTANGTPKLLDFGIAKLLDDPLTSQTLAITQFGVRLLTPEYASPEQIRCDFITPASDIYVLGILLYELLSGCRPFAVQGASAQEIERLICEQTLLPPSAAFEKSAPRNGQVDIAARRGSRVQELSQHLRGNLDAIVMAAMRREPGERYATAALLGKDIQHHLYGKPIAAVGPGGELRGFKRWVRSVGRVLWKDRR